MNTFHSWQSDCDRHARKNENADTLSFASQIEPSICTVAFKKCEKFDAMFLSRGAVACHWFVFLDRCKPYPLSRQGFRGSPISRRNLRGVPRDGRAMGANQPTRNPAKCLASCPRNFPVMAGQWPQQCRRMAVETTRKTTCPAPDLDAPETCETTGNLAAQQLASSFWECRRQLLTMTSKKL
jgi:hypothetical protein